MIAIAAIVFYLKVAKETGFSLLTSTDGTSRFSAVRGLFPSSKDEGVKTKEEKEAEEEARSYKKWRALIILFIVTICYAYAIPENDSSMIYKLGVFVVIALHLMGLWLLITEKKVSDGVKTMVIGYFVIIAVGLVFPKPVYHAWQKVKGWQATYNVDDPFANMSLGSSNSSSSSNANVTVIHAIPGTNLTKVKLPVGKVVDVSATCRVPGTDKPNGCITEIMHEGNQLCINGVYQNVPCLVAFVGRTNDGIPILKEQFKELPGVNVSYPTNLVHVIYSFGTTSEFGPSDIKVTTEISG